MTICWHGRASGSAVAAWRGALAMQRIREGIGAGTRETVSGLRVTALPVAALHGLFHASESVGDPRNAYMHPRARIAATAAK